MTGFDDNNELDERLNAATTELRSQLMRTTVPDPAETATHRTPTFALAGAFVVALLAGLTWLLLRDPSTSSVDTATDSELEAVTDTVATTTAPDVEPDTPVPDRALTFGLDDTAPDPQWEIPVLGDVVPDAAYGLDVRRVTEAGSDRFHRVAAPEQQIENANGTLLLTYHGVGEYRVVDLETLQSVASLPIALDDQPSWHPTEPRRVRHLSGTDAGTGSLQLLEYDLDSGQDIVIADLTDRVTEVWDDADFMFSRRLASVGSTGSRFAWIVFDSDGQALGFVSYDLANDVVLGTGDVDTSLGDIAGITMSVNGSFVVVNQQFATFVYDADLGNRRQINATRESDAVAIDADGNDAYVYIDFDSDSDDAGWLVSVDLATLARTRLIDLFADANTSIHISGSGSDVPGWVLVSTFDCKVDGAWSCDKLVAIELLAGGRVLNVAHTHNCGADFWTQTAATVNRSFTRAWFNSDGGSCGIDAEVYEVTIPEGFSR